MLTDDTIHVVAAHGMLHSSTTIGASSRLVLPHFVDIVRYSIDLTFFV